MQSVHLAIEGMSCGHCVAHVRRALESVDGVKVRTVEIGSADIDLDPAAATVDRVAEAVTDAGYTARADGTRAS